MGPVDVRDETKEDPCKRIRKYARDSTYGMESAGIARKYVKSEHEIDIFLDSCVPVMPVSKEGNNASRALHVAVRSDMDKSGNVCYSLHVATQSNFWEVRYMQCDSRMRRIMRKAVGFMKIVLYEFLDTMQAARCRLHHVAEHGAPEH